MADSDQVLGTVGITQRWKEFVSGIHARLMGAVLYGMSTSTAETAVQVTTGGYIRTQAQASTAVVGLLGASTADIGYVHISQTTPGTSNAIVSVSTAGTVIFTTGSPGKVDVVSALPASTASIGQVGGNTTLVSVSLAPTTSAAYAAGDLIGGQLTINNVFRSTSVMTGVLHSVALADKSTMQTAVDLVIFHTNTTGTTYTNDAALAVADGDLDKIAGFVSLTNGDYIAFSDNTLACKPSVGLPIKATTGTTLYAAAINRSTGPQYTSTGDLILTLGVLQD